MLMEVKAKPDDFGRVTITCPACNGDRVEPQKEPNEWVCCKDECKQRFIMIYTGV